MVSMFIDDEADAVDDVAAEGVAGGEEEVDLAKRTRSMVFTLHVNQELFLLGVSLGCAPVAGVPDPELLVQALPHKYLVYGREVCPTTGSFHLQGYVQFRNSMSFRSIHAKLAPYKAWLRCAYGTAAANRLYCSKGGDFFESGHFPKNENGCRWENALELARLGKIDDVDAQTLVPYVRSLERLEERHMFNQGLPILAECRNVWVCGPTRCGKSSILTRLFRPCDVYSKIQNKNWCNYRRQPVVLIDDVDSDGFGRWG